MTNNEVFPWRSGNSVQFYIDGVQFYPAMLQAINDAKKFILMEMYLFESGEISDLFINAFIDATKRGVTVQIIADSYGALGLTVYDKEKIDNSGVELVFYNPLLFSKFKKNLFRTHRKYLIIDGQKVFVGGAGITDSFAGKNAWRETLIETQGKVVVDWQSMFTKNFKKWSKTPVPSVCDLELFEKQQDDVNARLAYTTGGSHLEIKKVLLNRINNSQQNVWLASAYFIPSRKIRKALKRAAQNGKDVRLLLPGPITDHPSVRYASRRYYAKLLKFGVKIFEYQGRFTHTKMVLIDDWFSIGSSNMDRWNFRWNLEANQENESVQAAKQAYDILSNDFNNSHEITHQMWHARSNFQRIKEWFWGKVDLWLSK